MDINISKKRAFPTKWILIIGLTCVLLIVMARFVWYYGQAEFGINRKALVISEVENGKFTVSVRGSGVLMPDNVRWLSANVEGKVERVVVKAGNVVKSGDLIIELSNPQLLQELAETQWELEAQVAEAKATKVAQELALLDQQARMKTTKLDYESSLLKYNAEAKLVTQAVGTISKIVFERTRLETDQYKERWDISQEQLDKMRENLMVQKSARTARLNKINKTLERIKEQVDGLQVRATMDSTVLEVPLETGERVLMGANIAKLAQQDSLIAELQVPEIQIREVNVGQRVIIDTRNNKIDGTVSRIDPAVINGNVQVDVKFAGPLPSDARPDLSVDGVIKITEIPDTLHVGRPLFAQSRGWSKLYKLSKDEQFAERIEVQIGSGSINRIEILAGLNAGDKIIISDPTRFETYEKFRIE